MSIINNREQDFAEKRPKLKSRLQKAIKSDNFPKGLLVPATILNKEAMNLSPEFFCRRVEGLLTYANELIQDKPSDQKVEAVDRMTLLISNISSFDARDAACIKEYTLMFDRFVQGRKPTSVRDGSEDPVLCPVSFLKYTDYLANKLSEQPSKEQEPLKRAA